MTSSQVTGKYTALVTGKGFSGFASVQSETPVCVVFTIFTADPGKWKDVCLKVGV